MNYKQQQAQQMHQGSAPVLITPHKTLSPPCTSPFDSIMDDPLFKEYYWDLMIPYRLATLSERKLVLLGSKSRTSSSSTASTSSPLRRYSLISTVSRLAADKYHDRMLKFMMLKMKRVYSHLRGVCMWG